MALLDGTNAPTMTVEFDLAKLGTFTLGVSLLDGTDKLGSGASSWTAVPSADIRSVSLRRGRTREDQNNNPGALTLTLDNRSGNYDPDNTSSTYIWNGYSLLSSGLGVRVSGTWSGTTTVMYVGYLEQIDADESLDPVTVIQCTDALAWIGRLSPTPVASSYSGDTTATRVGRILDAIGWSSTFRSLTGSRTMQPTTLTGTALALSEQVARCEYGRFYADRQGYLTLLPYESTFSTPTRIALSDQRTANTVEYDSIVTNPGSKYLANSITVNQATGTAQTATNALSVARYGTYSKAVDAPLLDNTVATTLAQIIADRLALPKTRVDHIEFDGDASLGTAWSSLLPTDLGDNVTVARTTVDGRTRTFTALVESINYDITPNKFRVTMDLSPSAGVAYFTLGTSLLDGADTLYY